MRREPGTLACRALVIFQAFPPDPAAGGLCVADVCATLAAAGAIVQVIASDRGYDDPSARFAAREQMRGFEVRRVGLASFGKTSLLARLLGGLVFVAAATMRGLFGPRPDVVLVSTAPPMAPLAGLIIAAVRRSALVHWLMDMNPDQAIAIGFVRRGAVTVRMLDWLNRRVLRCAGAVIVLDDAMAERFTAKGPAHAKIQVIPPWGALTELVGQSGKENAFRAAHALESRFVVMYSGNHSLVHPLTTLLDAANRLRECPRFAFVFVGGGRGKAEVEGQHLPNVLSLPYQPRERLADSLGAADVHVVTMGDNMLGIVHPSKIYGILVVGRPVLYIGPPSSNVAEIVERHQLGWSIRHGDVQGVVDALRAAAEQTSEQRAAIAVRAQRVLARWYDPATLQCRVASVVLEAAEGR